MKIPTIKLKKESKMVRDLLNEAGANAFAKGRHFVLISPSLVDRATEGPHHIFAG